MNGNQMNSNTDTQIVINKDPSFHEVWREGYVEFNGERHHFWLVDPQRSDYELEVRWFFKRVPMEVRAMYPLIIESFKRKYYDDAPAESDD